MAKIHFFSAYSHPLSSSRPTTLDFFGNYIHDGTASLSRRARHMHHGRCYPRRDLSSAHAFSLATDLYPLRGTASPHRYVRATWQQTCVQAMWNQGNILPLSMRAGMPTWRGGRGVNGRPPTAACKGACVYKNAKPSVLVSFLLRPAFLFTFAAAVRGRTERADFMSA